MEDWVFGVVGCGDSMLGGFGFLWGGMFDFCILLNSLFDAISLTWVLQHRGKEGVVEVRGREACDTFYSHHCFIFPRA